MASSEEPPVRGVQRERTALAWERTGVAFLVVGALYLRATRAVSGAWWLAGVAALAFGCLLMLHTFARYTTATSAQSQAGLAAPVLLRALAVGTVVLSLLSAALIVARDG